MKLDYQILREVTRLEPRQIDEIAHSYWVLNSGEFAGMKEGLYLCMRKEFCRKWGARTNDYDLNYDSITLHIENPVVRSTDGDLAD